MLVNIQHLTTFGNGTVKVAKMVTYASKNMGYVRNNYSSIKKEYQNKGLKNSIKSVDKEYHIHYTKSIKSKERKF